MTRRGRHLDSLPLWLDRDGQTPWGTADDVHAFAEGIAFVSTPSHGGYYVSPALNARIPAVLRNRQFAKSALGGGGWYEEDIEWASVALTYPDVFPSRALFYAIMAADHFNMLTVDQCRELLRFGMVR